MTLGLFLGRLLAFRRSPPADDAELIARCLAGDRRAGRQLLDRLLPVVQARVWRCIRGGTPEGIDQDDLVQEVWASLFAGDGRALRRYDAAKGASLENFVGQIAQRRALNALEQARAVKRGGRMHAVDLDEARGVAAADRVEAVVADRDQLGRLAAHLKATLSERGWLIFRLLYTDGYGVAETAAALGVNAQVVYNWRHRIRKEAQAFAG